MKKAPCHFLWRGWAKYEVLPLNLSTFLLDFNFDLGENDCELELWSLGSKFFSSPRNMVFRIVTADRSMKVLPNDMD